VKAISHQSWRPYHYLSRGNLICSTTWSRTRKGGLTRRCSCARCLSQKNWSVAAVVRRGNYRSDSSRVNLSGLNVEGVRNGNQFEGNTCYRQKPDTEATRVHVFGHMTRECFPENSLVEVKDITNPTTCKGSYHVFKTRLPSDTESHAKRLGLASIHAISLRLKGRARIKFMMMRSSWLLSDRSPLFAASMVRGKML